MTKKHEVTHTFKHPKYYKELKKNQPPSDDKKDIESSSEEATGSSDDNGESTSASDCLPSNNRCLSFHSTSTKDFLGCMT